MQRSLSPRFGQTERATLCRPEMATASNAYRVLYYPTKRGVLARGSRRRPRAPGGRPAMPGYPCLGCPRPPPRPGGPPPRARAVPWVATGEGASALRHDTAGGQPLKAPQVAGAPGARGPDRATGGPGGHPPGKALRAKAKSAQKPTKIGRRRVATGANHPASHSSAFRRGPGTPAGAPTGDQSTVCMLHRNPPLCVKTGLPVAARRGCFLTAAQGRARRAESALPGPGRSRGSGPLARRR